MGTRCGGIAFSSQLGGEIALMLSYWQLSVSLQLNLGLRLSRLSRSLSQTRTAIGNAPQTGEPMGLNIKKEQDRLEQLSIVDLRERYHGLSSRRVSIKCKRWYIRRILWIMQAAADGDISKESRLLAKQIAAGSPLRKSILKLRKKVDDGDATTSRTVSTVLMPSVDRRIPEPGASLVKTYKGQTIRVVVRSSGFEFNGEQYKSLTAIARAVTGQRHINGFQFFNLRKKGTEQ